MKDPLDYLMSITPFIMGAVSLAGSIYSVANNEFVNHPLGYSATAFAFLGIGYSLIKQEIKERREQKSSNLEIITFTS